MTPVIDWPDLPAAQQPVWPHEPELRRVQSTLAVQPPLVFAGESDNLRELLASVAEGNAFVLMGATARRPLRPTPPTRSARG